MKAALCPLQTASILVTVALGFNPALLLLRASVQVLALIARMISAPPAITQTSTGSPKASAKERCPDQLKERQELAYAQRRAPLYNARLRQARRRPPARQADPAAPAASQRMPAEKVAASPSPKVTPRCLRPGSTCSAVRPECISAQKGPWPPTATDGRGSALAVRVAPRQARPEPSPAPPRSAARRSTIRHVPAGNRTARNAQKRGQKNREPEPEADEGRLCGRNIGWRMPDNAVHADKRQPGKGHPQRSFEGAAKIAGRTQSQTQHMIKAEASAKDKPRRDRPHCAADNNLQPDPGGGSGKKRGQKPRAKSKRSKKAA